MKWRSCLPCFLVLLLLCSANAAFCQASAPKQESSTTAALTNADVLEMLKMGLPAEVVAAKIRNSKCNFDTSLEVLKNLKAAAVPDSVLLAMVQAPLPPEVAAAEGRNKWEAFVPVLETLPWPLFALFVLLVWRKQLSKLIAAVIQRVESGAKIEAFGVLLDEPHDETLRPIE